MNTSLAGIVACLVALLCTCFSVALTAWQILMHLRNYTEPTYQRYIVRIIFMVPVYGTMSFLALVFADEAIWFNTIRDVYEAWVIYNFLSLCLSWVGGPGAVVTSLHGRLLKPSYFLMTCCLPAIPLDGRFIRRCKQGCLQFVFLKPILATLCLVLFSYGKYEDGNFSPKQGYLYITLVYMVSYSMAVYSLILFYVACKDLLRPFKPIPKFLIIKSVVFLTYWQGVVVFLLSEAGVVSSDRDAADLQNLLICFEMALAAVGFLYAFPHKQYMEANVGEGSGLTCSISHAINFGDVINDTVHQFAPTYHDYVLYSDGAQEAPRRYRTRTFVPTGQEMDTLRRQHKLTGGGGLLDDYSSNGGSNPVSRNVSLNSHPDELLVGSSVAMSETRVGMKGPLLYNAGLTNNGGYDMRPLPGMPLPGAAKSSKAPAFGGIEESAVEGSVIVGHWEGGSSKAFESPGESRRPSENSACGSDDSRRTSGADAGEETHLTKARRHSSPGHGMLMDEVDLAGDDDVNKEGHIQR